MNFNPFDSNLISVSVKPFVERFLINFSLSSRREEVVLICFFLRSFRFFVFVRFFEICVLPLSLFSPSASVLEHSVNRRVLFNFFIFYKIL